MSQINDRIQCGGGGGRGRRRCSKTEYRRVTTVQSMQSDRAACKQLKAFTCNLKVNAEDRILGLDNASSGARD